MFFRLEKNMFSPCKNTHIDASKYVNIHQRNILSLPWKNLACAFSFYEFEISVSTYVCTKLNSEYVDVS